MKGSNGAVIEILIPLIRQLLMSTTVDVTLYSEIYSKLLKHNIEAAQSLQHAIVKCVGKNNFILKKFNLIRVGGKGSS